MHAITTALLLLPLVLVSMPVAAYLALLSVLAPFGRRRRTRVGLVRRFAILVPAHNEELVIGRLLRSVQAVKYPAHLVDTWVVADNCTDATATIAYAHDARVRERTNIEQRGKGYALEWLLRQVQASGQRYDAFIIVDADSVLSPNFLRAMDERMRVGAKVLQGYYTVLPVSGRRAESLREAALALVHYLRPAAKNTLRASAGLKGNGMCFDRAVVERFGWPSAGLAEDVEFHLMLVRAGYRVEFAPEAVVRAEMPETLATSDTQNLRWEAGRLATIKRQALPLLGFGLRRRNIAAIDAAVEQIVPPLSVPVAVALLTLIGGMAFRITAVWATAAAVLAVFALHIGSGLLLARVPLRVYRALLHAPLYMGWKVLLYGRALTGGAGRRWVRTERVVALPRKKNA